MINKEQFTFSRTLELAILGKVILFNRVTLQSEPRSVLWIQIKLNPLFWQG